MSIAIPPTSKLYYFRIKILIFIAYKKLPLSEILGFLNMYIICHLSIYVLAIFIKYFKVINPGIFRTYVTSIIKAIKHNIGHSLPQFYIINSIGDNVQFSQHSGMSQKI
jgi:hypothetical protein